MQPNPSPQRLSAKVMATDCLNGAKMMAARDVVGAMDSTNPGVRQAFLQMSRDHLEMADELFQVMQWKGWYRVSMADQQMINQAQQQFQPVQARQTGMVATPGGSAQAGESGRMTQGGPGALPGGQQPTWPS